MINGFLESFYKTISFKEGQMFKSEQFRSLFCLDAILFEKTEDGFIKKHVEEHIREFETVIRDYPQLFIKGFQEVQVGCKIIECENCFLIRSEYQKTYYRNNEEVVECGQNNMTVIDEQGCFKIASIVW